MAARPGRGELEVIAVDEVGRPRGRSGRRRDGVDVELAERRVDAVDAARPGRSRAPGCRSCRRTAAAACPAPGSSDCRQLEDLLRRRTASRDRRVRVVERDRVGQCLARHRHAGPRREVCLQIAHEVEEQHQELAVARREGEPAASRSTRVAPAAVIASSAHVEDRRDVRARRRRCPGASRRCALPAQAVRIDELQCSWSAASAGALSPRHPSGTPPVAGSRPSNVWLAMTRQHRRGIGDRARVRARPCPACGRWARRRRGSSARPSA